MASSPASTTTTTSTPVRAAPSAAGAITSTRTSTSPPHDGTRVSLGRKTISSGGSPSGDPFVSILVALLVCVNTPLAGTRNPMGARHGSLASLLTCRTGNAVDRVLQHEPVGGDDVGAVRPLLLELDGAVLVEEHGRGAARHGRAHRQVQRQVQDARPHDDFTMRRFIWRCRASARPRRNRR